MNDINDIHVGHFGPLAEALGDRPVESEVFLSFDEIEAVLAAMQRSGAHLAIVEEGGEQQGVVFLEDILEELVGEVRDAMQRRGI